MPTFDMLGGSYLTRSVLLEWLRASEDLADPRAGDPLGNLEHYMGIEQEPPVASAEEQLAFKGMLDKLREKNPDLSLIELIQKLDG